MSLKTPPAIVVSINLMSSTDEQITMDRHWSYDDTGKKSVPRQKNLLPDEKGKRRKRSVPRYKKLFPYIGARIWSYVDTRICYHGNQTLHTCAGIGGHVGMECALLYLLT